MWSSVASGLFIFFFYTFNTLIGQIILPYGINDSLYFGNLGIIFLVGGILGGICVAIYLSRNPGHFQQAAFISPILTIAMFAYFIYSVY